MFGVVTQGLTGLKLSKTLPKTYLENVLKKVNAKLGGQNSCLEKSIWQSHGMEVFDFNQTMVVGMKVIYFSVKRDIFSLITAAVGSLNADLSKYGTSIRIQEKLKYQKEEIEIDEMIIELMEQFKLVNKRYPSRLIVFRSGIRENQFSMVQKLELPKIQAAFQKMSINGQIVLLTVQKKHKIRLVDYEPSQSNETASCSNNLFSGTVIDHTIVHPNYVEFLLNSHKSFSVSQKNVLK